ncbi:specifically androgen-regulated gene protein [Denticeps clupeoides]|uniref:Specifically androgen-regulated gene protein n=1 Tax=Denticeps clupeoides TaxID=299321 RepID=A0AAY4E8S9_9TELE|nr:specifically androgen-regulated gene protein [Denticeps clupeoides]XP_028854605.1 specifically androgen-regulated gene protein [Denticeps clupeoides]
MPKSDTWSGGIAMATVTEMDSAGSCDSVVSTNSGFSDDGLEHLSAEERACLLFLEETIESLATEEDSGLSADESDQLPAPGSLASKIANLSASIRNSSHHSDAHRDQKEGQVGKIHKNHNQISNYLVPTPLVLANGTSSILNKARKKSPPNGVNLKKQVSSASSKVQQGHRHIPSEANVLVIPPPSISTGKMQPGQEQRSISPRGPLSYEGLVQLRKSASMKRAQTAQASENQTRQPSESAQSQISREGRLSLSKPSPPAVAPKPNKIPSDVIIKSQESFRRLGSRDPSGGSPLSDEAVMNPQRVRIEALQKLGLLKEQVTNSSPVQEESSKFQHTCFHHLLPTRGPSNGRPSPACTSTKSAQCSGSIVHHRSMNDLRTVQPYSLCVRSGEVKSATLEHSGMGLGSCLSHQNHSESSPSNTGVSHNLLSPSLNQGSRIDFKETYTDSHLSSGSGKTPVPSPAVSHSTLVVPNMGVDRREALRKLGLLKN